MAQKWTSSQIPGGTSGDVKHSSQFHQWESKPFPCNVCSQVFQDLSSLQKHSEIHGQREFKSAGVNVQSPLFAATTSELFSRRTCHSGGPPAGSDAMNNAIGSIIPSDDGLVNIHADGYKPHNMCSVCVTSSNSDVAGLQEHVASDGCGGSLHCGVCPEAFRSRPELVEHMLAAHTWMSPLSCNICQTAFLEESQLMLHMKRHFAGTVGNAPGHVGPVMARSSGSPIAEPDDENPAIHPQEYSCGVSSIKTGAGTPSVKLLVEFPVIKPGDEIPSVKTAMDYLPKVELSEQTEGELPQGETYIRDGGGMMPTYIAKQSPKHSENALEAPMGSRLKAPPGTTAMDGSRLDGPLDDSRGGRLGSSPTQGLVENETFPHTHLNMKTDRGEKKKRFPCDCCSACFSHLASLKIHERIHSGEKPYVCTYCQMAFTQSGNLKAHVRRHTGEKPFECDVCSKCFSQKVNLQTHQRTHTGQKPFHCGKCQASFTQAGGLQVHMKHHAEDDERFACIVCKAAFVTEKKLEIHVRSHTGRKPHQCPQCEKSFVNVSGLENHVKKQHSA